MGNIFKKRRKGFKNVKITIFWKFIQHYVSQQKITLFKIIFGYFRTNILWQFVLSTPCRTHITRSTPTLTTCLWEAKKSCPVLSESTIQTSWLSVPRSTASVSCGFKMAMLTNCRSSRTGDCKVKGILLTKLLSFIRSNPFGLLLASNHLSC